MAETQTNKKARSAKMTHKERKAAQAAAARKAQLQWWAIGGTLAVITVLAIVLISVYTEGSLPVQTDPRQ